MVISSHLDTTIQLKRTLIWNEEAPRNVGDMLALERSQMTNLTVELTDVQKHYELGTQTVPVLNGLSLQLKSGEICAIMGPSGVGKSTMLNIVSGLETLTAGKLIVCGKDLSASTELERTLIRRTQIGVIYQFFNLVPNLTVRENIELPFLVNDERPDSEAVNASIEMLGLAGRIEHYPSQLSGGEQQLVTIARAIVRSPSVILADEPTGNLNVATGRRVMKKLVELTRERNTSLLLVTHNPEDAALADRVVFMTDGKIDEGIYLEGSNISVSSIHETLSRLEI